MNKPNRSLVSLIFSVLIVTAVACASTPKHESAGQYVDDSGITTKVKSKLAADNLLKSFEIGVETYKGVVQLSGFVDSQQMVNKAGQVAMSVKGVRSVRNDLVVKPTVGRS